MGILSPTHLIIILVIVLIIFGPSQLPKLGASLGKTMRSVKEGMETLDPKPEKDADEA
ncbi:MAG TPA: twin-arginine translocase TatA/TatE family subunit [Coriobacteriia bacterium]|jgi:sec-independent protein translocase protein TatA